MICSKCKIDKEANEFQTYWHSVHQKHYTRRECTQCMYKQKSERKKLKQDPDYLYKDNPNYMKCTICLEWKLIEDNFYIHKKNKRPIYRQCKECRRAYDRNRLEKERNESGGGDRYKPNPNEYVNESQKNAVFKVMLSLGWQFCEETQTWHKEGIKDKYGNFSNIRPYLDNRQKYVKTPELIKEMKEMRKDKFTYKEIAKYFGMGYNTVFEWINK